MDIIHMTMMKNISFILIFSLLFSMMTIAQGLSVSEESARTVAENFYFQRIQQHRTVRADNIHIVNSIKVENDQVLLYYIFNMSTGGYVAVSAYDATPPVLCYSFSNEYQADGQPENFKAWMDQYKRQIAYAIKNQASPSEKSAAAWKKFRDTPINAIQAFNEREVLPLTTSTWDQGMYYNEMCPEDPAGPDGHCVTGCVATTLGQLMYYFRWPESGTGTYSYECPPYGTLSVDYENANYQWDLMENALNHSNPEVSQLLYHAGVSVDMVYGPDGSGMYNHKGAYMLKTYFKYSPETQYVFRDSTSMDWDSLLVTHLDQQIPLYYAGWSVPDTIGHAFICDGYQGEDYFHFNWGWGGAYDDYFYTDDLTPGGNMFNLAQELIINAVPDTNLYDYPVQCQGDKTFSTLFGTIDDGSGPLYSYENATACSWLITPDDSVNSLSLSFHSFSTDTSDYVSIYDGIDISTPLLGMFSGEEVPPTVTATSGNMFVVFESNDETTADGFLASFESDIPVYCSGMVQFTDQTATLSDGSGNWDYHNNTACLWRILPEGASSVTLYFTYFETEAEADILKIYDLQTTELLAEYSGPYGPGLPDPVTSPSGKLFLTFNTNTTGTAPGWEAYYESDLVSVPEVSLSDHLILFPNPTNGLLTIQLKYSGKGSVNLSLTDLSGRKVFSQEMEKSINKLLHLDLGHLSPGIYILNSETSDGSVGYHKIIIR